MTALDLKTGSATKTCRLSGALDGYYASPVASEGRLYFTSDTGKIVVVGAGGDWTVLATNDLDDPCYAHPSAIKRQDFCAHSVRRSIALAHPAPGAEVCAVLASLYELPALQPQPDLSVD